MKKNVLIIAYYFPPFAGGGVQRTSKFVKYLAVFSWSPFVLTVNEKNYFRTHRKIDYTLNEDIPKTTVVKKTNFINLENVSSQTKSGLHRTKRQSIFKQILVKIGNLVIFPDAKMLWIPVAVYEGIKMINKYRINLIYSTGNPWSDHIIGAVLHCLTKIPWVADYRDPWNLDPYLVYSSALRRKAQLFIEKQVIKNANKVIFTTNKTMTCYQNFFGYDKYITIRNAYDPDDFKGISKQEKTKLTVLYAGNMQPYRGPYYFVKALGNLLKKYPEMRNIIEIHILGHSSHSNKKFIAKEGLDDIVRFTGHVNHKIAIDHILNANVLLSVVDKGGELIIPGKIYEYLASGKPILALVPKDGATADILRYEKRSEYIVDPRDIKSIEKAINKLVLQFINHRLPSYPTKKLHKYTRLKTTEKLANLFNQLI